MTSLQQERAVCEQQSLYACQPTLKIRQKINPFETSPEHRTTKALLQPKKLAECRRSMYPFSSLVLCMTCMLHTDSHGVRTVVVCTHIPTLY